MTTPLVPLAAYQALPHPVDVHYAMGRAATTTTSDHPTGTWTSAACTAALDAAWEGVRVTPNKARVTCAICRAMLEDDSVHAHHPGKYDTPPQAVDARLWQVHVADAAEYDPDTCQCGDYMAAHTNPMNDGHTFTPWPRPPRWSPPSQYQRRQQQPRPVVLDRWTRSDADFRRRLASGGCDAT